MNGATIQPLNIAIVIAEREIAREVRETLQDLPVRVAIEQPEISDWDGFQDKLNRLRADVVLLEVTRLLDGLPEVVLKIRSTQAAPAVIAVHATANPDVILRSVRAGAIEFLAPPLGDSLIAALERISNERTGRPAEVSHGRSLAFFSAKGGCGATTLACHLAVELARLSQRKLLLADFDLNTGTIDFLMKTKARYTVLDAVQNINRLDQSFWTKLVTNGRPNMEIISAPKGNQARTSTEDERLSHILHVVRDWYEWVVVDIGRGLNNIGMQILGEADEAILVTGLDVPALYHAKHIIRSLQSAGYGGRLRVVLNRISRRSEMTSAEIQEMLGMPVFAVLPEDGPALHDAYSEGELLAPNSSLGRQIVALAQKISGAKQETKRKKFSFLG
jgi:pilus assembly protein CpaE